MFLGSFGLPGRDFNPPEQLKPSPMPADQRFGFDDHQS
jgi:hypothetical protein